MAPYVSVIMGVYNGSRTLKRAINSIRQQSVDDFEFIICDDASTDDTWRILTGIASIDKRLKLLQNYKNMGLAASLNRCISNANGTYIARQDADDISSPHRFKEELVYLDVHPNVGFVGTDVVLYSNDQMWGYRKFPELPEARDFLFSVPFLHGTLMFRKETLISVGSYRVSKETLRCEDYDLLMRVYSSGIQGANIGLPLYWYLEDFEAAARRKYSYRFDEAIIRYKGFRRLHLLPKGIPYVIKPLVVGMIPITLLEKIKKFCGIYCPIPEELPEFIEEYCPLCWRRGSDISTTTDLEGK